MAFATLETANFSWCSCFRHMCISSPQSEQKDSSFSVVVAAMKLKEFHCIHAGKTGHSLVKWYKVRI